MGLFQKKECALCGGKAGLLTRFRIAGDAFICGDCRSRMSPNTADIDELTLDGVREQIRIKEENDRRYRTAFSVSRRFELDDRHPVMAVDDTQGAFALLKDAAPDIFSFDQLESCYVDLHTATLSEEERKKDAGLIGALNYLLSDDFGSRYPELPHCPRGCKVTGMYLEFSFGPNPFHARKARIDMMPGWANTGNEIERAYFCANEICQCVKAYRSGAHSAAAEGADSLSQIRQLKELLDLGAITQAEFDAKKKQLLGL